MADLCILDGIVEQEFPVDNGGLIPELVLVLRVLLSWFPAWTTGGDVFLVALMALEDMGVENDSLAAWLLMLVVLHPGELAVTVAVVNILQVVVFPEVGQELCLVIFLILALGAAQLDVEVDAVTTPGEFPDQRFFR